MEPEQKKGTEPAVDSMPKRRLRMNPTAQSSGGEPRFNRLRARDAAIAYAKLGLLVFPLWKPRGDICRCRKGANCQDPGKHPRTRHGHRDATSDLCVLKRWKWETANVGTRTGAESGIVVIDIDDETAWKALREQHGRLPMCPYVETPRPGWHLYYRHPGVRIPSRTIVPGVEIKGDDGYVVASPSLHFSGGQYLWKSDPSDGFPELPESWVSFLCHATQEAQESQESQESSVCLGPVQADTGVRIAKTCVPSGPGNRNNSLIQLCRKLRAVRGLSERSAEDLEEVFEVWYRASLPYIRTKDRLTNYGEFCLIWNWVKCPWGTKLMSEIKAQAESSPTPASAVQHELSEEQALLLKVCRELQRLAGDTPFFLSARTAADTVGVHWTTASAWLRAFVAIGWLSLERKGTRAKQRATEYRYLAD